MTGPSVPTVKRLFSLSGNRCAFPNCILPVVDVRSGKVTGKICHIKARRPGGRRHDATLTSEHLHAFENLILLCGYHHDLIDANDSPHSVEDVVVMKQQHEATATAVDAPDDRIVTTLITEYALAHASLAEVAQQHLTLMQQQVRVQRMERAGVVFAYIDDQQRIVTGWLMWVDDPKFVSTILGRHPPVLLPEIDAALQNAMKIDTAVYRALSLARQELTLFDSTVTSLREWHTDDAKRGYRDDKRDEYFQYIHSAERFLETAELWLHNAKGMVDQWLDAT